MAVDTGGVGSTGGTIPGMAPPPVPIAGAGGGLPNLPGILPTINLPPIAAIPPTITTPDYAGILNQLMAPYESGVSAQEAAFNAQMAALRDQIAHQRGFAEEAYGINKEGDQAAYDTWLKDFIAKLVGRGMYNSGARNYYTDLQKKALARQLALLANSLHSYLFGLQSQLTNAQLSGQGQMAALRAQLAGQRASIGMQLPYQYPGTVTDPGAAAQPGGPIPGWSVV